MKWDSEVDMICAGSGASGLASAISVVDLGGEVFVASTAVVARSRHTVLLRPQSWLDIDVADADTAEYLSALASDLGPRGRSTPDLGMPIRAAHVPTPADAGRTVAPFVGARLRKWTARCLESPYGYLYSRVSDWPSTTLESADGEMIEAFEIGAISPDPDNVGGSVVDWLTAQARDRDIDVHTDTALERLVFEEGDVVGAVFTTPDGILAIRARHGVTVAGDGPTFDVASSYPLPDDAPLRVCMVGQHASRFGRVELVTSMPIVRPVPSTCRPRNRRLHAKLHDKRSNSNAWRCGKVDGYPPSGE